MAVPTTPNMRSANAIASNEMIPNVTAART